MEFFLFLFSTSADTAYKANRSIQGTAGPPSYNITRGQLEFFLELGFKGTDIAKMLQVSRSTVMRRLRLVSYVDHKCLMICQNVFQK